MSDFRFSEQDATMIQELLPDRSDEDIPPQIEYVLSIIEVATLSHEWLRHRKGEPVYYFVDGFFDYYIDGSRLEEPHWEQIYFKDLKTGELESNPSLARFCYQQGAIAGYALWEEYDGV